MSLTSTQLALDSNLLLLLTVGSFEPRTLRSFKRLSTFTAGDLRLLQSFAMGRRLVVTPHLLTEVSNLANSLPELLRQGFLRYLAKVVTVWPEEYTPAAVLVEDRAFSLFGLTDAAFCSLAARALVVTEDGRLRAYMKARGFKVLALADLRPARH